MHKIQQRIIDLSKHRNVSKLTLSDIASEVGAKSPQIIKYHLDRLKADGHNFEGSGQGTMHVSDFELVSIPIVGAANCGPAEIFAEEHIEGHLKLSSRLLKTSRRNDLYAVRAQGSSMNRARVHGEPITDGDYVIIDSQNTQPQPGDYVVAVVDGLANIKRYYFDPVNSQVAFISESSEDYAPIFLHESDQYDALIAGKVIQVISCPR